MADIIKHCIYLILALIVALTTYIEAFPKDSNATPISTPNSTFDHAYKIINKMAETENSTQSTQKESQIDSEGETIKNPFDGFVPGYSDIPISVLNASGRLNDQMIRDVKSIIEGFGFNAITDEKDLGSSVFGEFFDSFLGTKSQSKGNQSTRVLVNSGIDLTSLMLGFGKSDSNGSQGADGLNLGSLLSGKNGHGAGIFEMVNLLQSFGLGSNNNDIDNDAPGGAKLDLMSLMGGMTHRIGGGAAGGSDNSLGSLVGSIMGSRKDSPIKTGNLEPILSSVFAGLASMNG